MKSRRSAGRRQLLPLLPLKDMVVFPRMVLPLLVGRPASIGAVDEAVTEGEPLFLCAQRDAEVEEPGFEDLFGVGVTANVLQTLRMPDGTLKVVVEAIDRGVLRGLVDDDGFQAGSVEVVPPSGSDDPGLVALVRVVRESFEDYVRIGQRVAPEVVMSFQQLEDYDAVADLVCAHLAIPFAQRQELLEAVDLKDRLEKLSTILSRENELLEMEQKVRERLRDQMERGQREYFLQEQMRAIQQELSGREGGLDEFTELREAIANAKMPREVEDRAMREMSRYERMPALSPESAIARTYLEWLTELPWSTRTRDKLDLKKARKILDEDHYGLERVKERILEFLAVRKLSKSTRGPVLCLVGPPGVGKTSLGRSIARAMGRKFVRVSLGGVRDEAEIRGHRRTYIGAMPGRILQSMKKVEVVNPVFMLDEVDKMSVDFRGDPSAALLEVLDPEQNRNFSDHYLEIDYDLHEVFFITTANSEYYIPEALLDRMEVVRLSGYSPFEKVRIAQQYLIPKQIEEAGLTSKQITFTPEGLELIVYRYTQEAGVRELERQIAKICRKVAYQVVSKKASKKRIEIERATVQELLGPPEYPDIQPHLDPEPGLAVGLAWTTSGGDTLVIETTVTRGKGDLKLTGQLGEVMQESAQAAYTYIRARARELGISSDFWRSADIHIHVPEGAIPKDGPSAGTALTVSMVSALRKKAPKMRAAMTGEITLRGKVLEVGGIKEKVLGAHRAGIRIVFMPKENQKDLKDVPDEVKNVMTFHFVDDVGDVLKVLFPAPVKRRTVRKKTAAAKKR